MLAKRIFDLLFSIPGIVLLSPFILIIMGLIKLDDGGSIFFRQIRVGMNGQLFRIFKFRTMKVNAESLGAKITSGDDERITRIGKYLRKYKIDEIPQLINVIRGEMSLVGPRPEVPEYMAEYTDEERAVVLSVPPGMTDLASIEFKDENRILADSSDVHRDYVEKILPIKKQYYIQYVNDNSIWLDFYLIIKTIWKILF